MSWTRLPKSQQSGTKWYAGLQMLLSQAVLFISVGRLQAQPCACCRGKNTRGSQMNAVPSNR